MNDRNMRWTPQTYLARTLTKLQWICIDCHACTSTKDENGSLSNKNSDEKD